MSHRYETNAERIESLERQLRKAKEELAALRATPTSADMETPVTDGATFEVLSPLQSGTIKVVRAELAQRFERELNAAKHDIEAYRSELGYSIPESHNGLLHDGTKPIRLWDSKTEQELAASKSELDQFRKREKEFPTHHSQRL